VNGSKLPLARIERFVDALYSEPNLFDSAEGFERANHDDLAQLTLDELDAERILARFRWAVLIHNRAEPSLWLQERIARLDQAAVRLRPGARR
jgi:hypothetical protein